MPTLWSAFLFIAAAAASPDSPAHTPFSVMDFVTTLPAPITTPSQMLTARIVAPLPIDTSSPISIRPPAGAVGVWFTLAKQVVGKHHAVTDKAALADGDVLADKGMGLNFTVRADAGIPWISTNGPTKTLSPSWQS